MAAHGQTREVIAGIVARSDMDAFTELVLDSFWDRAEFRSFRPPRDELRTWVRWNIELVIRWLVDGRPPDTADVDRFRALAQALAREGIPPDVVPANFRQGARFAWTALLDAAREDERLALLGSADLLFDYVDLASQLFYEAYETAEGAPPVSSEERRARSLLERIVSGADLSAEDHELAERLGFPLSAVYRPFVMIAPGRSIREHAALAADLRRRGSLATSEGQRVIGLAARDRVDPGSDVVHAHGDLTVREHVVVALDELRALGDVARARGVTGAVRPDDHLPELLLRRSPRLAGRVSTRVYGGLDDELARTLDLLVENDFDRSRTAASLPAHRNTLTNRLRRIRDLTGLGVDSADGRGLVWLAWVERRAGG